MKKMDKIDELLTRGVDRIYPTKEELEKVLRSGKKLRLYLGIDPSGQQLHIGHTVVLRKLRQFQDLGHHVILLIGDFTGMIGDPTGKGSARKKLTREQVLENAKDYKKQASKILRFEGENPIELQYNNTWLSKLTFEDVVELASNFTVQQMIERDMFQERLKTGIPVSLHEFLYPLMVAYDCVAMNVDLELGGSDQTFNMLAGRTLMKTLKNKEKFVLTVPLLTDSQGKKIGKTEGNSIAICGKPDVLYAQIMSLGDDSIIPVFELTTNISGSEIDQIKGELTKGVNPMVFKKKLAWTIVAMYNSTKEADGAQGEFERTVQQGETPSELNLSIHDNISVLDALVNTKVVVSRSEAKRLIREGGVEIDGTKVKDVQFPLKGGKILKVGKRNYVKIIAKN